MNLRASETLENLPEIQREENIRAPLQLVGRQVAPIVQLVEYLFHLVHVVFRCQRLFASVIHHENTAPTAERVGNSTVSRAQEYRTGLMNGDIGLCLAVPVDGEHRRRVVFRK